VTAKAWQEIGHETPLAAQSTRQFPFSLKATESAHLSPQLQRRQMGIEGKAMPAGLSVIKPEVWNPVIFDPPDLGTLFIRHSKILHLPETNLRDLRITSQEPDCLRPFSRAPEEPIVFTMKHIGCLYAAIQLIHGLMMPQSPARNDQLALGTTGSEDGVGCLIPEIIDGDHRTEAIAVSKAAQSPQQMIRPAADREAQRYRQPIWMKHGSRLGRFALGDDQRGSPITRPAEKSNPQPKV